MPELPHLSWPIKFATRPDGTLGYSQVQQDTDDDLFASAGVILSTSRGHRDDDPTFGITPLPFQGLIDTDRLAGELTQADPRLDAASDELIDEAVATSRTVRVSTTGGQ